MKLQKDRSKFYVQTNNELDHNEACQVTVMSMGLDIGQFGLYPINSIQCQFRQPEDKLRWYMLTNPDVQAYWKRSHPGTLIPAPEWADCMVFTINRLYGKNITYFDGELTLNKITSDLNNGIPIYTSMRYPDNKNFNGTPSPIDGHIVLIVGIEDDILINDPYKNHLTGDRDGFENRYTLEEFKRHNKGYAIRYRRV